MLWVSDNGIPDLGGDIEEETCYFDEVCVGLHKPLAHICASLIILIVLFGTRLINLSLFVMVLTGK